MKIKTNEADIKAVLLETPKSRENDFTLYFYLLKKQGHDPDKISAAGLLRGMYHKTYPHFESVRRCRQSLQEHNPELQGLNYAKRHKEQANVKEELNYIETPHNANGMTP